MRTQRSKQERRNDALERAKLYTWENSKMFRLPLRPADLEQRWNKRNADHITHLESIKTRA